MKIRSMLVESDAKYRCKHSLYSNEVAVVRVITFADIGGRFGLIDLLDLVTVTQISSLRKASSGREHAWKVINLLLGVLF
jgi:hypothetical protein